VLFKPVSIEVVLLNPKLVNNPMSAFQFNGSPGLVILLKLTVAPLPKEVQNISATSFMVVSIPDETFIASPLKSPSSIIQLIA
jgi:hypothetical protein